MKPIVWRFILFICFVSLPFSAQAGNSNYPSEGIPNGHLAQAPECYEGNKAISINNERMLHIKQTEKNQFLARGNLYGTVTKDFNDSERHVRFEIQIGNRSIDVVEIIYNIAFGPINFEIKPGMRVQACGDFINSFAPTEKYPASPSGAIIHWLHLNPRNQGQEHGYLQIEGRVFGYDWRFARAADDGRRDRKNRDSKLNLFLPLQNPRERDAL